LTKLSFLVYGQAVNGQDIVKRLKSEGWAVLRQEGSHVRMGKGAERTTVPLHGKHDLKPGTLASIERQTGIKLR
jgi:predicted RNA binding protein YcfA (HicA-like mRNA interferase family)